MRAFPRALQPTTVVSVFLNKQLLKLWICGKMYINPYLRVEMRHEVLRDLKVGTHEGTSPCL